MGGRRSADPGSDPECSGVTSLLGYASSHFHVGCTVVCLNLRLQGAMLLASQVWVLTSAGPKDLGGLRHRHRIPAWYGSSEPRTPEAWLPISLGGSAPLSNWLPSCFAPWCLRLMLAFSLTVQAWVRPCSKR